VVSVDDVGVVVAVVVDGVDVVDVVGVSGVVVGASVDPVEVEVVDDGSDVDDGADVAV
jgi:hypothetical protein